MEEWRDIPGHEGRYQVSSHGRVKSCAKEIGYFGSRTRLLPERIMSTRLMYRGYASVHLRHAGERKHIFIHQLVAITFHPNPDGKPYVNHIDRDKTNNHISNLEWVTEKENTAHWMADDKAKAEAAPEAPLVPADLPW